MSKIVVEKEPNKTLFLIDGHLLCSYELDSSYSDSIRATIRDSGGVFLKDCNSIYIRKTDFEIVTADKIKEFLAFHMGKRLGDKVYAEIVQDFGLFHKLKEKVVFT